MKNIFIYTTALVFSLSLFASPIGINIGTANNSEDRIKKLENEVIELRSELRALREKVALPGSVGAPVIIMPGSLQPVAAPNQVAAVTPQKTYACFIKSTFNGTFTGKGQTLMEAKGDALKACSQGGGGLSCSESNLKCDE